MAKSTFSPMDLNQIIEEATGNANSVKNDLHELALSDVNFSDISINEADDDLPTTDDGSMIISDVIGQHDNGASINPNMIYSKVLDLIEEGKATLQVLRAIDPDVTDATTMAATATLIRTIKDCLGEFTKIHQQHIRFQQNMQLLQRKHELKLKEMEYKAQLIQASKQVQNNDNGTIQDAQTLHEFKTDDMIAYMNWKRKQQFKDD